MKLILTLLVALCTTSLFCTEAALGANDTFCNPLNIDYRFNTTTKGSYREAADPVILMFQDDYYLFASKSGGYWWSHDFRDWHFVKPTGIDIEKYAPAILVDGKTMYYTSSSGGSLYKTSDPKSGVWTKISSPFPWSDPCLLKDDDGRFFCYEGSAKNGTINVVELDPKNNFSLIGKPIPCLTADQKDHGFEVAGANNDGDNTWVEGSWINKINGHYYLQYAAPDCLVGSYGDGCYVSDSPTGPFKYQLHNPVTLKHHGFVTGVGHGALFQDRKGNWWKVDSVVIAVKHMFERRLAVFPADIDKDGLLHSETALGDWPMYLPGINDHPIFQNSPGWNLLSYHAPATASSSDGSYIPANAVDEDIRTWWAALTDNPGEYLQIDLQRPCQIHAIQINFAEHKTTFHEGRKQSFTTRYRLLGSLDNKDWKVIADRSESAKDAPHDYLELSPEETFRYLKVENVGPSPGGGVFAIRDLRIFGNDGSGTPATPEGISAKRIPGDDRKMDVQWNPVKGANGYVVRFGISPQKLYNHYQVLDGNACHINCLDVGKEYWIALQSYSGGGLSKLSAPIQVSGSR